MVKRFIKLMFATALKGSPKKNRCIHRSYLYLIITFKLTYLSPSKAAFIFLTASALLLNLACSSSFK